MGDRRVGGRPKAPRTLIRLRPHDLPALARLDEGPLQAILRAAEGQTPEQVADAMGITVSSVRQYRHRALKALRVKTTTEAVAKIWKARYVAARMGGA